jgi:hypothetical protein
MVNVNKETEIRYGVTNGHNAQWLLDVIYDNGDDLTYAAYKQEMLKQIKSILDEMNEESLALFVWEHTRYNVEDAIIEAKDILEEQGGDTTTDSDAEGVFDRLELNENYECDEAEYSYTDSDGNQFLLGYLGGAPLIWCIKTNRIVRVKSLCSPCVPNAGDLDSGLTDDDSGYACYGIPAEYISEEEN